MKVAQGNLQKLIIWMKKLGKGRQEWEKACVKKGLWPKNSRPQCKQIFLIK